MPLHFSGEEKVNFQGSVSAEAGTVCQFCVMWISSSQPGDCGVIPRGPRKYPKEALRSFLLRHTCKWELPSRLNASSGVWKVEDFVLQQVPRRPLQHTVRGRCNVFAASLTFVSCHVTTHWLSHLPSSHHSQSYTLWQQEQWSNMSCWLGHFQRPERHPRSVHPLCLAVQSPLLEI